MQVKILKFLGLRLKQVLLLLGNILVAYLAGENSIGEFYSVALTNNYQQADTGTKMIHVAPKQKVVLFQKDFCR